MSTKLLALGYKDSVNTAKPPKHYFSKTIYLDSYAPQKTKLDHVKPISRMLETYQLRQFSFGCNLPVFTKDFYSADGTRISNFHLLLNASVVNLKVSFDGISTHTLSNSSIGMRALYNDGKKGIFYAEMAPFLSQDRGYSYTRTLRMASTVLYNYSVNDYFGFRIGYTRTFLWGNRYHLPFIGFRFGHIDKVNLSIQFPRNITFTMPVSSAFRLSLYTKPVGGLYTFANVDSIPLGGTVSDNQNIYFGRYEFLSGIRMDVQPSKHITTKNKMLFYTTAKGKDKTAPYPTGYFENIKRGVFLNVGCVIRFGQTKSIYNNTQMYNAMDLNNNINPSDDNVQFGNGNVPLPAKKMVSVTPDDVLDLIEAKDLY
jgi:hypothetical protein